MATYTPEQYAIAGQFISDNINNPELVREKAAEFNLSNEDLLRAAQTQQAGITMGQVQEYMGTPAKPVPMQQQPQQYQPNPYLDQMAAGITQQTTRNLNEQIMPGIRSQAIAAGGFGDARHGVAEGLAIGRTNDALTNALANLYGTDYQKSMDRNASMAQAEMQNKLGYAGLDTQRYGIDANNSTQRYGLDLNNGTQRYGIDTNAATSRYGTDKGWEVGMAGANASMANAAANQAQAAGNLALGQQRLGVDLSLGLLDRQTAMNSNGIQMGTNIQNTPAGNFDRFNQQANSMGQGFSTQTQTQQGGGTDPLMGVAGMARIGQSWLNQSGGNNMTSNGGWGTGNNFGNQDLGTFL